MGSRQVKVVLHWASVVAVWAFLFACALKGSGLSGIPQW